MPDHPVDPHFSQYPRELRKKAETLLKDGHTPSSLEYLLSADALKVLYKLASSSNSADDCLKLLHELQTHQIELDLQHEQSMVNEREAAAELARYKALYEFAPAGYFVVNAEGRILESNRAAADLLGFPCNDLNGSLFETHLSAASWQVFSWKLKKLFNGSAGETCTLNTVNGGRSPTLRVFATLAPDGEVVLMNIVEPGSPPPG